MELLRLVIGRREELEAWRGWLVEPLFGDDLTLAAFRALEAAGGSVREASEVADPRAGDLLVRLAAEESSADPADVVTILVREASRRAHKAIDAAVRLHPERAQELAVESTWLGQRISALGDGPSDMAAAGELVAWLARQSGDNDG
jgi:hypothetical protein